jgi:signal transduction histidine kinase
MLDEGSAMVCLSTMMALDELPDGVLVVNRAGRVEGVNPAFLEMINRPKADVLAQPLEVLVAEEDMLRLVGFDAMFGYGPVQDGNVIFIKGDGSRRALVVCAAASRDGTHVLITARASGVVQKELADTSRWAADEQERALDLAAARDALFEKNAALSAAQDELQLAYEKLKGEAKTRERLEAELSLAQRLEAIGQLSAGVAHEINTPLQYIGDSVHFLEQAFTRILAYSDTVSTLALSESASADLASSLESARKKLRLPFLIEEVPKALGATRSGLESVSVIVRAMKAFSLEDEGDMSPRDINQAIKDTLTVTQAEYKPVARIVTELAELPPVYCFIGKLNQVFSNLIVNAAHAINDAKRPDLGTIRVRSRHIDGFVEVAISDDGCGIPEKLRHKIFEPFFTTKEVGRGSGQGLSIAHQIVVGAHHGTLSFDSQTGVGTTFVLRLPIAGVRPV